LETLGTLSRFLKTLFKNYVCDGEIAASSTKTAGKTG
jgi:hypothetical protein